MATMVLASVVSEKHLRFLNTVFRASNNQSLCQDVELKCSNGSLLYNKLQVGLVFPGLRHSTEYQLSLCNLLLLPQFSVEELFDKFNKYFGEAVGEKLEVEEALEEAVPEDDNANVEMEEEEEDIGISDSENYEEIVTELIVQPEEQELELEQDQAQEPEQEQEKGQEQEEEQDKEQKQERDHQQEQELDDTPAAPAEGGVGRRRRHPCCHCTELFMHRSSLLRHIKSKHRPAMEEDEARHQKNSLVSRHPPDSIVSAESRPQPHSMVSDNSPSDSQTPTRGAVARHQCSVCQKTFRFRTHLLNHENTHSKPHKCGHCEETFAEDTKLASHEINVHGQLVSAAAAGISAALMKCSFCPKVFPARSQAVLHERTHTKERPFQCAVCSKRFAAKCNLTAHERIHAGESKRYSCRHPPCDRKFSHTSERKDHETAHTGDRPYLCTACGERYRRNANLWRHKKRCHGRRGELEEVDSRMIVEEDTDFIMNQETADSAETKYEIVFVDAKPGREEVPQVASEQVVTAS